eukprot:Hpha_TRINITY_DN8042_c0_g2::TRINITY_DN8042_c0_g2_i1::g.139998::m.139998
MRLPARVLVIGVVLCATPVAILNIAAAAHRTAGVSGARFSGVDEFPSSLPSSLPSSSRRGATEESAPRAAAGDDRDGARKWFTATDIRAGGDVEVTNVRSGYRLGIRLARGVGETRALRGSELVWRVECKRGEEGSCEFRSAAGTVLGIGKGGVVQARRDTVRSDGDLWTVREVEAGAVEVVSVATGRLLVPVEGQQGGRVSLSTSSNSSSSALWSFQRAGLPAPPTDRAEASAVPVVPLFTAPRPRRVCETVRGQQNYGT